MLVVGSQLEPLVPSWQRPLWKITGCDMFRFRLPGKAAETYAGRKRPGLSSNPSKSTNKMICKSTPSLWVFHIMHFALRNCWCSICNAHTNRTKLYESMHIYDSHTTAILPGGAAGAAGAGGSAFCFWDSAHSVGKRSMRSEFETVWLTSDDQWVQSAQICTAAFVKSLSFERTEVLSGVPLLWDKSAACLNTSLWFDLGNYSVDVSNCSRPSGTRSCSAGTARCTQRHFMRNSSMASIQYMYIHT